MLNVGSERSLSAGVDGSGVGGGACFSGVASLLTRLRCKLDGLGRWFADRLVVSFFDTAGESVSPELILTNLPIF